MGEKGDQDEGSLENVGQRQHHSLYKGVQNSKETWEVLKDLYETTNKNRVLFLKTNILSIKMKENGNVSNFLSRSKELKDKLANIGEKI